MANEGGDFVTPSQPKGQIFCPWGFLDATITPPEDRGNEEVNSIEVIDVDSTQNNRNMGKKSYANTTKTTYGRDVDTATLPTPGRQGEYPTISIQADEVDKELEFCKLSLATPLGRGYIMFHFTDETDYQRVWTQGTWVFDDQVLRLSKWTPNFSTSKENHSNALVWIRFPGLSLEYWEMKTLFSLGRAVGRPIHTDENTAKRKLGYYASVLVDVDLTQQIPEKIWVEVEGRSIKFWQKVDTGHLPKFCNHCKRVGHLVTDCRILKEELRKNNEKETNGRKEGDTEVLSRNQKRRNRRKDKHVVGIIEAGPNSEPGQVQNTAGNMGKEIGKENETSEVSIEGCEEGHSSERQKQDANAEMQDETQVEMQEESHEVVAQGMVNLHNLSHFVARNAEPVAAVEGRISLTMTGMEYP
ncbi:hypothetical protein IFM89_002361 [Coptis chinensis]|uniref:DUF4283 domain-containing protein n=1 Tax=Coptis chinensis TaxID=261450 RepID=A0A835IJ05_9MAGN|nr:hypothetical protein IFM89_002361 [Coptis chinensis]